MKKHRIITILLAAAICLTFLLISCSKSDDPDKQTDKSGSTTADAPTDSSTDNETRSDAANTEVVDTDKPLFIVENVASTKEKTNIAVRIFVKNNPGISSIALTPVYDGSVLKLTGYEINAEIGGQYVPYNASVAKPKIVWLNWMNNVEGDWLFATLFFDITDKKSSGETKVSLSYNADDLYNQKEENIEFGIIGGTVTIRQTEE